MIFSKILGMFSNDLSIDLGTANTIVIVKCKGTEKKEQSVVAVLVRKKKKKETPCCR